MTLEYAIRLARKWAFGGVCSLREGEAQEYHKMALAALEAQRDGAAPEDPKSCATCRFADLPLDTEDNPCWNCKGPDHSEWLPKVHQGAEGEP